MNPEEIALQAMLDGKASAIETERILNALARLKAGVPTGTTTPKTNDDSQVQSTTQTLQFK